MNKSFLFATSSRKIKSHVEENQITLLVWLGLLITEKQRTINSIIIFNDLISNCYQCSIRGFCRGISIFVSICLSKKKKKKENAWAIEFLGILKKHLSNNKYIFVWKRKAMFLFKKSCFCLSHKFQTSFHNTDHLLYNPQMSVVPFHTFFCSLISYML